MSNGVERGTRQILSRPEGVFLGAEYSNDNLAPNAEEINLEEDSEVRMGKAARYLGSRAVRQRVSTPIFRTRDNEIFDAIKDRIRSGTSFGREATAE